jgi:transcriptional regulator with PAS, ATPase and Fis domain
MNLGIRQEVRLQQHQVPVLIGKSLEAEKMREFIKMAGTSSVNVLLQGETGTGKDHIAEMIHYVERPDKPFITINCGGISETLLESELFGHVRGAFTDASANKKGLVDLAEGGTLFLNEVGNVSLQMQARLLQILEHKPFRPVGGTTDIPVKSRIVVATNLDLASAVREGKFRSDLYYRMNVLSFEVCPLRERKQDILQLVERFLKEEKPDKPLQLGEQVPDLLLKYSWPGNVRELKNLVLRCSAICKEEKIEIDQVQPYLKGVDSKVIDPLSINVKNGGAFPTLRDVEIHYLRQVLVKCEGNVQRASRITGLARTTLDSKIERYGLMELIDLLKGKRVES